MYNFSGENNVVNEKTFMIAFANPAYSGHGFHAIKGYSYILTP